LAHISPKARGYGRAVNHCTVDFLIWKRLLKMLAIVHSLIEKQKSDNNKTPRVFYKTGHKNVVCGHFDRPHQAKGMCKNCRQRFLYSIKKIDKILG
jgi:hypothetical protein